MIVALMNSVTALVTSSGSSRERFPVDMITLTILMRFLLCKSYEMSPAAAASKGPGVADMRRLEAMARASALRHLGAMLLLGRVCPNCRSQVSATAKFCPPEGRWRWEIRYGGTVVRRSEERFATAHDADVMRR